VPAARVRPAAVAAEPPHVPAGPGGSRVLAVHPRLRPALRSGTGRGGVPGRCQRAGPGGAAHRLPADAVHGVQPPGDLGHDAAVERMRRAGWTRGSRTRPGRTSGAGGSTTRPPRTRWRASWTCRRRYGRAPAPGTARRPGCRCGRRTASQAGHRTPRRSRSHSRRAAHSRAARGARGGPRPRDGGPGQRVAPPGPGCQARPG
jgi:hypothetical protein